MGARAAPKEDEAHGVGELHGGRCWGLSGIGDSNKDVLSVFTS